jgi:hypothetical protein
MRVIESISERLLRGQPAPIGNTGKPLADAVN